LVDFEKHTRLNWHQNFKNFKKAYSCAKVDAKASNSTKI